uniref:Uncharacterized protein n=1 Tax=Solanum lycopersicum TaxID=4081 RepID=A0A3Q7EQF8_SOLLC
MLVITIHSLTGNATPIFVTKIFLDQIFGSELWSREVNTGTGMLISFCQCCAREVYDISLIFYSLLSKLQSYKTTTINSSDSVTVSVKSKHKKREVSNIER